MEIFLRLREYLGNRKKLRVRAMRALRHAQQPFLHGIQAQALQGVEHRMSHHSRTQAFAEESEKSEEASQAENRDHSLPAFIAMAQAKDCRLNEHAEIQFAGEGGKLLLQIAAKHDLFNQSSHHAQKNEESEQP